MIFKRRRTDLLSYEVYDNHLDSWVVFIHGMGGSTLTWKKQISAFSDKYNLLLIDLPGHGNSQRCELGKRIDCDKLCCDIKEVLDHLRIKTADFVSLSLGTLVTAHFAIVFPKYVNSMIFSGAVMKINFFYKCLMTLTNVTKSLIPHRFMFTSFARMMLPRKNHEKSRKIFIRESLKMKKQAILAWVDYVSEIAHPQKLLDSLKKLNVKMLFISGDEDVCFVKGTKKVVEFLKKPKLEIIKKCGHVCSIEKYNEYNEKVLKFLDSVHKKTA